MSNYLRNDQGGKGIKLVFFLFKERDILFTVCRICPRPCQTTHPESTLLTLLTFIKTDHKAIVFLSSSTDRPYHCYLFQPVFYHICAQSEVDS